LAIVMGLSVDGSGCLFGLKGAGFGSVVVFISVDLIPCVLICYCCYSFGSRILPVMANLFALVMIILYSYQMIQLSDATALVPIIFNIAGALICGMISRHRSG